MLCVSDTDLGFVFCLLYFVGMAIICVDAMLKALFFKCLSSNLSIGKIWYVS